MFQSRAPTLKENKNKTHTLIKLKDWNRLTPERGLFESWPADKALGRHLHTSDEICNRKCGNKNPEIKIWYLYNKWGFPACLFSVNDTTRRSLEISGWNTLFMLNYVSIGTGVKFQYKSRKKLPCLATYIFWKYMF